ncbi:hypothetical protein A2U01_0100492, partial [Trifolium medium]|nr:hypothetical protein [Trifolium medium]
MKDNIVKDKPVVHKQVKGNAVQDKGLKKKVVNVQLVKRRQSEKQKANWFKNQSQ